MLDAGYSFPCQPFPTSSTPKHMRVSFCLLHRNVWMYFFVSCKKRCYERLLVGHSDSHNTFGNETRRPIHLIINYYIKTSMDYWKEIFFSNAVLFRFLVI